MMTINRGWVYSPWNEMRRFEREMNDLFYGTRRAERDVTPPINVYSGEEDVIITSELPGIEVDDVEISVRGDMLTLKGKRQGETPGKGETWHRRERGQGSFYRTLRLPYNVEGSRVEATYDKGVLKLVLPRAEAEKPRKITVKSSS